MGRGASRIMCEHVVAGPGRDPEETLKLVAKIIFTERVNAAIERTARRHKFEVVDSETTFDQDGNGPPIPAGYADLFNMPKATE